MLTRMLFVVLAFLMLFGCSDEQAPADPGVETDNAAASEASDRTEQESTVETPTPEPTALAPTAVPTAVPTPEPPPELLMQVDLPVEAVASPWRSIWGAAGATANEPLVGFGHRHDSATNTSMPVAWAIPASGEPTFDDLPLPDGGSGGYARGAGNAFGGQLGVGEITIDDSLRAAYWSRSNGNEWVVNADFASELLRPELGESSIAAFQGSSEWAMLRVEVESPTEFDDEGDRVNRTHLLLAREPHEWEVLELPGVNPKDWFFGIHIDGDNAFISARLDDDDSPSSRFFISTDAGVTWQANDVALIDNRAVSVSDVLWDGDRIIAAGSIGIEADDDPREPAMFVTDSDGTWRPERASLVINSSELEEEADAGDEPAEVTAIRIESLAKLDDTTFVAVADTDPGSRTFTSTNGIEWTHAPDLWLNQYDERSTANFRDLLGVNDGGPLLALRRFASPVWISSDAVTPTGDEAFEVTRRNLERVVHHDGRFVAVSTSSDRQEDGMLLWESPDGHDWQLWSEESGHTPSQVRSIGDAIVSVGLNQVNTDVLYVHDGEESTDIDLARIFEHRRDEEIRGVHVSSGNGRDLIMANMSSQNRVAFLDLSEPSWPPFMTRLRDSGWIDATCPQLPNNTFPVLTRERDTFGAYVALWQDQTSLVAGRGVFGDEEETLPQTVLTACANFGEGMVIAGVSCSSAVADLDEYSVDECDPNIWLSQDGVTWEEHPAVDPLNDAGVQWSNQLFTAGPGAVMVGYADDSDDEETLWLITPTEILPIDLRRIGPDANDIRHVAISTEHMLVANTIDIFAGDLDAIIGYTLGGDDALQQWHADAALAAERRQAIEAETALLPQPTAVIPDPSTAPEPTSPPASESNSAPAPTAVPAPTVAPATAVPNPTAPPVDNETLPVCQPGQLTVSGSCDCSGGRLYDDGGQCKVRCRGSETPDGFGGCTSSDGSTVDPGTGGDTGVTITTTIVCTTTVDAATGEATEVCERPNG